MYGSEDATLDVLNELVVVHDEHVVQQRVYAARLKLGRPAVLIIVLLSLILLFYSEQLLLIGFCLNLAILVYHEKPRDSVAFGLSLALRETHSRAQLMITHIDLHAWRAYYLIVV